MALGNLTGV